jgi:Protein of unknown function (DUF2911)
MRKSLSCRNLLLAFAALFFVSTFANAQCKPPSNQNPVLSPPAQATVTLNNKPITIDYCAPSLRGRQVGDQIAPYDKVWRTGANSATTLTTHSTLRLGKNLIVAPGMYTLYSIPSKSGWTLIVNKQTGQWGTVYNENQDLGRVKMMDGVMPSAPVEVFKIGFDHTRGNKTILHLQWGLADVYVPIEAVD